VDVVNFTSIGGDTLNLAIHRKTALLLSLTSVIDMPLLGMVEMSWHWSDYARLDSGAMIPGRLEVVLGERVLKEVGLSVSFGSFPDAFAIPEGIDIGDPPDDILALEDFVPYGQRPPEIEALAPYVYMVKNLRSGFGMLFVEFDEFVVAVDAPTGWFEMNQIPPMNWSHGDSVSALGEKYLTAIRQTIPNKPVRHLVLTHHHSDHIGGILPFIDAGASVFAGASAAHMAKVATTGRSKLSFQGNATPQPLKMEIVDGKQVISDGEMEMQLIELPDGNPKADNYLMVYLPKQKLLYATAFIYPIPEAVFPPKESIPLSIYFVKWLDEAGLDIETIYNVHAMNKVEPWQLEAIRQIATVD
jgi:glyoxylase-like metal-dependent hydrolase (beta-lactamase superfamily II)